VNGTFKPDEWTVVIPKRRDALFASPYLHPAAIVTREAGSELEECVQCGQLREGVALVTIGRGAADVCADCRKLLS
jgi:hypothetical protein